MQFGKGFMSAAAAVLRATPPTAPLASQKSRTGEKGFVPPLADLEQVHWLVGQWKGEGIEGAAAMESWLPPSGGAMVGAFVRTTVSKDGDDAIMFTEHMNLMEEDGSLALRLKHFNAALTGWEDKDDMLTSRLVAIEDRVACFHALTLRCDEREDGRRGLLAAARMQSGEELLFRLQRME